MKVKKKKNKNKKKKKKNKKKSKSKSKRLARKHVVVASIEAHEVLANSKADVSTDETKAAKQKVFEATKAAGVQINLISNPEAIETLLQKEAKTTTTAFYLVNLGTVVDKYFLWMKHLPRAVPHYGKFFLQTDRPEMRLTFIFKPLNRTPISTLYAHWLS